MWVTKRVAVFDFDHTLVTGDSFWPYLSYVVGKVRTYAALTEGLVLFGARRVRGEVGEGGRTFMKDYLLRRLLAGKTLDQLHDAAVKTRAWQVENTPVMRSLR